MGRIVILKWRSHFLLNAILLAVIVFAASNSCNTAQTKKNIPCFNGKRAFEFLEYQVAVGPRVPGTREHDIAMKWIFEQLRKHTSHSQLQSFTAPYAGVETDMVNILASFYPDNKERILLCAHWDSRHHADNDPDSTLWSEPVPGANDGASGVAVLLEIASCLTEKVPPVGVDIVMFDGEDGGEYGDNLSWLLGSRYFARAMPLSYRPKYAVLIDMIGDTDLALTPDINSKRSSPVLWNRILELCKDLEIAVSLEEISVLDDHIPLIQRGIPSVDLIDFDYIYWHTVSDIPEKCSAESLEKIGKLLLALIYGE